MKATLSELARHTAEIVRPVIHGKKTVILTDRGQDCAKIVPLPTKADRKGAWKALMAIGPVEIKPRK